MSKRSPEFYSLSHDFPSNELEPIDQLICREEGEELAKALALLQESERYALEASAGLLDHRTMKDAANAMRISRQTLYTNLNNAQKKMEASWKFESFWVLRDQRCHSCVRN